MKTHIKIKSIIITFIATFIFGYIEIELFEEYGWTLFLLTPFLIGFLPPFIIGRCFEISKKKAIKSAF